MSGYIIVKDETKNFWKWLSKVFGLKNEKKVIYSPYKSKTQVLYTYERNSSTGNFPPISIEIFLKGSINDDFYAIVKVPIITFDHWYGMNYSWHNDHWKIILDFDINKDIRLKSETDQVEIYISTD